MKHTTVIGIDPGVDKSGVAMIGLKKMEMLASTIDFPNLVEMLRELSV